MEALKMETPMDNWNDDRLDELSGRVDTVAREMKEGFARVDREMKEGFADLRGEMREGFARVDKRFERLYYVLITTSVGLVASVLLTSAFG